MNVQSASLCLNLILTKLILAEVVNPAYSSFILYIFVHGTSGLSFQKERRSGVETKDTPFFFNRALFFSKASIEIVVPSTPTLVPFCMFSASHFQGSGVPSVSSFISLYSVPSICCAPWIKYLLSTQRRASSLVMTTVPAEPEKPEMNSLVLHLGATYSL